MREVGLLLPFLPPSLPFSPSGGCEWIVIALEAEGGGRRELKKPPKPPEEPPFLSPRLRRGKGRPFRESPTEGRP